MLSAIGPQDLPPPGCGCGSPPRILCSGCFWLRPCGRPLSPDPSRLLAPLRFASSRNDIWDIRDLGTCPPPHQGPFDLRPRPPCTGRGNNPLHRECGTLVTPGLQPVLAAGRNTRSPKRNCIYTSSIHPAPGSQKGLNKWVSKDQGGHWGREDLLLLSHTRDEGTSTHPNHGLPPPQQALGLEGASLQPPK